MTSLAQLIFCYLEKQVRQNYNKLCEAFSKYPKCLVAYSYKTNYSLLFVISCIRKEQVQRLYRIRVASCEKTWSAVIKNIDASFPSSYIITLRDLYPPPTRSCNYCLRFHVWIHSNPLFRILLSFRRSELLDTRLATSNISQVL